MWNTLGRERGKEKELIESRGRGGNLLILSSLRPFSRSKRHRPGVTTGFTSLDSVCDIGALTKRHAQQKVCVCVCLLSRKRFEFAEPLLKWAHCLNPGFHEFQAINLGNLYSCQPWGTEGNSTGNEGGISFQLSFIKENAERGGL